jgi:hypothetical protein
MRRSVLAGLIGFGSIGLLSGCTEPGETTKVGAATGGVMGAGLGAIIGSQTGDPGAGLVLGAVAGSGTGALVGNSIEAQQKAIRSQDEALERQQRIIQSQKREIEELRRNSDSSRFDTAYEAPAAETAEQQRIREAYARARTLREGQNLSGVEETISASRTERLQETRRVVSERIAPPPQVARVAPRMAAAPRDEVRVARSGIKERDLTATKEEQPTEVALPAVQETEQMEEPNAAALAKENPRQERGAYDWSKTTEVAAPDEGAANECADADAEVKNAESARETADKLFHFRRALRLCPNNADYHTRLGEVYQSLNRPTDAVYEYKEALNIDPSNSRAKDNLAALGR